MSSRLLCLLAMICIAPSAFAHARLVKSLPVRDAVLTEAPAEIALWFNELLDARFNAVEVFAASELTSKTRRNLATAVPTVNPADRTQLSVALPKLPPGEYIVQWRVLSRDGHSAPGRFTFRIGSR